MKIKRFFISKAFNKTKRPLTLIVFIILFIALYETDRPSVEAPIDLSKEGSFVEFEVVIPVEEAYEYRLWFERPQDGETYKEDLKEHYKFTGTGSCSYVINAFGVIEINSTKDNQGEIVPLRVTIHKINSKLPINFIVALKTLHIDIHKIIGNDKELICDDVYDTVCAGVYSMGFTIREFGFYRLKKGVYIVRFENLKAFEFMKGKEARIDFRRFFRK